MTALWELPDGWEWVKFSEVATVASDLVDPAGFQDSPHIAPNHIESGTGRLLEYATVAADKVTSPKHRFKPGQILYSKIRPYLCKAVLIDFAGVCSADMYPITSKIDAAYLHRWMISSAFTEQASGQQGRTVLPKINQEALARLSVPVPSLDEQRRIVARIEALQNHSRRARAELEAVPPLLEQYRHSVLAAALRGDLTAEWRKQHPDAEPASALLDRIRRELRETLEAANARKKTVELQPVVGGDLPDLPDEWCWVRFGDVMCELRNGVGTKPEFEPPGQPILRINAVRPGRVLLDDLRYLRGEFDSSYLIADGDILFTRYNGSLELLGVCGVVRGLGSLQLLYPDKLMRVRLGHTGLLPDYVEAFFSAPQVRRRIELKAKSSAGQQGISGQDIKDQLLALPPLAEQQEIARLVAEALGWVARTHQLVAESLGDLQTYERSVLAQAFRGELIEQDPADEPATVLLERIRAERNGTGRPATAGTAHQAAKLLVVRYLVLLLRTWNAKAARETLETCLVLMLNDDARRAILGKKPAAKAKTKKAATGRTHMPGLDRLLGELVAAKFLTPPEAVRGRQVFGLGANAPSAADLKAHARPEDEGRLKETLDALEALGEERSRLELDAVSHATYELVS